MLQGIAVLVVPVLVLVLVQVQVPGIPGSGLAQPMRVSRSLRLHRASILPTPAPTTPTTAPELPTAHCPPYRSPIGRL